MHRFFVDNISGETAFLSQDDSQHAVKVLRLNAGDVVEICDCNGYDYDGEILNPDKNAVSVRLSGKRLSYAEPNIKITLIQCLPKVGKMEVIIQKCTELGVCEFIPVESKRCVVRVDEKSKKSKLERYNKVAYEAAKQSGRGIIPKVLDFSTLDKIDFSDFDYVMIPYEEETETTIKQFAEANTNIFKQNIRLAVIIGSEGGFEKSEVLACVKKGATSVTLGKRILRTETAGMAAVAMLMGLIEG